MRRRVPRGSRASRAGARHRAGPICNAPVARSRRKRDRKVHMSSAAGLKFQWPYGSSATSLIITPCLFESVPTMRAPAGQLAPTRAVELQPEHLVDGEIWRVGDGDVVEQRERADDGVERSRRVVHRQRLVHVLVAGDRIHRQVTGPSPSLSPPRRAASAVRTAPNEPATAAMRAMLFTP